MITTGERNVRSGFTGVFNELLHKLHLNYTEFAELLAELTGEDVPRNRVRLWATGVNVPEFDRLYLLGELFGLDMNAVFYNAGEYWSPTIRKAQEQMREWSQTMADEMTPAQRLVAAWEKFHELYPSMHELVWAGYLRWLHFPRGPLPGEEKVLMVYWLQAKFGSVTISKLQLDGASDVTGIPTEWFENGNSPQ